MAHKGNGREGGKVKVQSIDSFFIAGLSGVQGHVANQISSVLHPPRRLRQPVLDKEMSLTSRFYREF